MYLHLIKIASDYDKQDTHILILLQPSEEIIEICGLEHDQTTRNANIDIITLIQSFRLNLVY